jgi:hypothetical protein
MAKRTAFRYTRMVRQKDRSSKGDLMTLPSGRIGSAAFSTWSISVLVSTWFASTSGNVKGCQSKDGPVSLASRGALATNRGAFKYSERLHTAGMCSE